ncbi:MAG: hypothetical protein CVV46_13010 [Spirochaetae bacterium HGW-Spirochaetae-2]|nr:MAG: hypothetical protein CVV46_13010 [Spirochaetae bacterium HGW-Spirochaetae-2]
MIASIAMFNTYSGNYEDSPEAVELKGAFLSTAEDIVASYLGFDPKQRDYADIVCSGTGSRRLYLPCRNIQTVESLIMGTTPIDTTLVAPCDDHIRFVDHTTKFPIGEDNIRLSYTAGWEIEQMPSDNSRTFVNYSNYRKYLQPLDSLRILGF